MSNYNFIAPPVLTGGAQEQIRQLSSYLYRMNENLNVALNSLSPENFVAQTRDMLANGVSAGANTVTMEILQSQYDALKADIRELEKAHTDLIEQMEKYTDDAIVNAVAGTVTDGEQKAVSGAAVAAYVQDTLADAQTVTAKSQIVIGQTALNEEQLKALLALLEEGE